LQQLIYGRSDLFVVFVLLIGRTGGLLHDASL
jgi:hypothetical protein